jgi:hypothetical protein
MVVNWPHFSCRTIVEVVVYGVGGNKGKVLAKIKIKSIQTNGYEP